MGRTKKVIFVGLLALTLVTAGCAMNMQTAQGKFKLELSGDEYEAVGAGFYNHSTGWTTTVYLFDKAGRLVDSKVGSGQGLVTLAVPAFIQGATQAAGMVGAAALWPATQIAQIGGGANASGGNAFSFSASSAYAKVFNWTNIKNTVGNRGFCW